MTSILDVIQKIEKVAPVLAAALAKMNPVADVIYTLIAQTFGASRQNHEEILAKINSDPEADMKLRQLEYSHIDNMKTMDIQKVESAREREIEVIKLTGKRDHIIQIIALVVIVGFFVTWGLLIFNPDLLTKDSSIVSHVVAAFMMVVNYYF